MHRSDQLQRRAATGRRGFDTRAGLLRVALVILVVMATAAALACGAGGKGYIDSDLAFEYRSRVETGSIHPRWQLVQVARRLDRPDRLVHVVQIPPEDAGELMMLSDRERARTVAGIACPNADDPIWSRLSGGHDVEGDMPSDNGLFDTVTCRDQLF